MGYENMDKMLLYTDGSFILPKKYVNKYPIKITTSWIKMIIYHKKGSFFESIVVYHAPKNKPYIEEGLIKINDDIYQIELIRAKKEV